MWETEASVNIRVRAKHVYLRLVDFTRHSDFSAGLSNVEQITPGPAVGTRFRAEETPFGFLMLNLHRKRNAPQENRRTLDRIKAALESEAVTALEEVATR